MGGFFKQESGCEKAVLADIAPKTVNLQFFLEVENNQFFNMDIYLLL